MSTTHPPTREKLLNAPLYIALAVLAALAVVTVIVLATGSSSGSSSSASGSPAPAERTPRKTVELFMKAAETGDGDKAAKYCTEDVASSVSGQGAGLAEGQSYEVGDETVDGDSAEVSVAFSENGTTYDYIFKLTKESGEWLIDDVQLS